MVFNGTVKSNKHKGNPSCLNSGFGVNTASYGGRWVDKKGKANVEKRGLHLLHRISWYHTMIDRHTVKFMLILVSFYVYIYFVFALIYFVIGIEYLNGIDPSGFEWVKFGETYFFSAQTFATVGYGHISPTGFLVSEVFALEALFGLLSFAIATGLFLRSFSKPAISIKFSHNVIIAPYRN